MARTKTGRVNMKMGGPLKASDYQTIAERIQWLRAKQKPFMTQVQLSRRAGVNLEVLRKIEQGKHLNMTVFTLIKLAHALDCKIYINIKTKPSPLSEECQPLDHELPPLPKRTGKTTPEGRVRAELYGSYPWKKKSHKVRPGRRKETSDISGSEEV